MSNIDRNAARRLKRGLEKIPVAYLLCRDLLHAWDVLYDFEVVETNYIERSLCCRRCGTLRHDSFSATPDGLVKDRSRYAYPQDYQLKNVPRGVKPGVFIRGELFKRSGAAPKRRKAA